MSGYSNSPKILKAGIVLIDPQSGQVQRIISLQYNPDSLSRSLQVSAVVEKQSKTAGLSRR